MFAVPAQSREIRKRRKGETLSSSSCLLALLDLDDFTALVLAAAFSSIKNLYDEKHDRSSFIKNIIMDNILASDIYIKSKELHFDCEGRRVVMLVKFYGHTELLPYEMVQVLFPDRAHDYVISVGENDIVLVKDVEEDCEIEELEKLAAGIVETLNSEFYVKVAVGISTVVDNLRDLEIGRAHV